MSHICLTLWPGNTCGWHGICVPAVNTSTFYCSCDIDNGWSRSEEFDYFSESPSLNLCSYNSETVRVLYLICAAVSGIGLALQLTVIRKFSQLKRMLFSLLSLIFPFAASAFRLQNERTALFGRSFGFMFLVAFGNAFIIVAIAQFLLRYILYMRKSNPWMSLKMRKLIEHFGKWHRYLIAGDLAVHQLLWIAYFVERSVAVSLLRICLLCMLLRVFYIMYFSQLLLGQYIKDLETVKALGASAITSTSPGEERRIITELVTKHIPRARVFRRTSFLFGFMGMFYFGIPLCFNFGINSVWTYFIPISYILWTVLVLNAIYAAVMRKLSARKLKGAKHSGSGSSGNSMQSPKVMSDTKNIAGNVPFQFKTQVAPTSFGGSTKSKVSPQSTNDLYSRKSESSDDSYV